MLNLSYIKNLNKHYNYISSKFNNKNVFLVWWCVRDLLLWVNKKLLDIDIACAWNPVDIYKQLNKTWISHFNTEKYWTITVIPKSDENSRTVLQEWVTNSIAKKRTIELDKESVEKRWLVRDWKTFPYNPSNLDKAKLLRKKMTKAESKLWHDYLKKLDIKFYRQRPIDHFIVDFYCSKYSLVIEIDWWIHDSQKEYDKMRTDLLNIYWLQVIRFTNDEVLNDFDNTCKKITSYLQASPKRGGAEWNEAEGSNNIKTPQPPLQGGCIQYELTPFRAESEYTDNRHPDEIIRSDDLIKDASRRDFTINSLYYSVIDNISKAPISQDVEFIEDYSFDDIYKYLSKNRITYLSKYKLLILQDHNVINKLFPEWELDQSYLEKTLSKIDNIFWTNIDAFPKKIWIILDPNNGIQDLIKPKITAIWDPEKRFQEDALRIVRALRFVSVLNKQLQLSNKKNNKINLFDIDKATWIALRDNTNLVENIAKERIKDEITKVLKKGSTFWFVSLLDEINLLEYIFPSLQKTKNNEQPVRYHPFDTYAHTLLTLYELEKINNNYLVKMAMLYHDVWKPEQYWAYSQNPNTQEIREILSWELNHRNSWPKLAQKEFSRLTFSKKEISDIMWYIAQHHTPWEILDAKPQNREKKLRKLYSSAWFEKVNNLLDITIADRLWQYNPMQNSADITDVEDLRDLLKSLKEKEWQFTKKDMKISGTDIMKDLKIEAWPKLWELIDKAFNRVLNDIETRNNKTSILNYIKTL